ncbi:MAG TPA: uroporphyrinogen decarboxylase family protein [Armatimonadota bacterium]|jgi:uroporphyrinogen decarboxylase
MHELLKTVQKWQVGEMNFAEYVQNAGRPLAAPLAGFPGITLTKSTVFENLHDGLLQAKTITALHNEVSFDIVFPMMDLTVEAEALGAKINWNVDELPSVTGTKVLSKADAESLIIPKIGEGNRLGVFVETCSTLKRNFPDKPVWSYVLGPFSTAGRLTGMTEIAMAVKLEPDVVHSTLCKANDLIKSYAGALLDTGVDGLMVLEPAAGMLGLNDANEFSNAYIVEIIDIVKARGKTPALHNCGKIMHLVESLCATGIEVLHVGSVTDPFAVYPRVPDNVVVMGNIDPTAIFLGGTPDEVKDAAMSLRDRMSGCSRFIISSGCDIPSAAPIENLVAFSSVATGS